MLAILKSLQGAEGCNVRHNRTKCRTMRVGVSMASHGQHGSPTERRKALGKMSATHHL